ncbi:RNA polymerase subunit sigma [Clostridium beijerinckii]|uniref:Sigma-70 family RNA polymerase sigma factor n=1 Tax=Clostridium beijerinckii TaxID=1520 RepID=A0AB74VC07_CLOBE|nr:sigma-70 family RNA polymerase sigma factor [Clostridium beijerinckii]NRZ28251.1 RNA polymerase sigma-70 factor (ECF subfamily) [Clostridium beijerinckii]NYB95974.1 RNA polymerase sigma-70 factor (ECF subfamily) [Clostridium beijerinckii]OOM20542.1 RNA polymerase sigma factor YlaC [Clostridium beijerinckii]QUN33976.1 sigma-70 family RNA polymerase sigma factor [Clostridium beijerinckii]SQB01113.1 ECF subfamily RNA polymerase sigma-24 factor [Clostridium beijerinckii]
MKKTDFEIIYELYVKNVFKFLLKLTKDYDLAEDLTQETFVKAFNKIESFKGKSKLIVWLCQIGKNLYFDYLKKTSKIIDIENIQKMEFNTENLLEDDFVKKDELSYILKIVMQMCDPYKTVFFSRTYLELSYKEIGKKYGKNETWARVTFHRAKLMLQKSLKEMKI